MCSELLDELAAALAERVRNPLHRFEVTAAAGNHPTAFALPGGYIFVAPALVELTGRDRDQLAFVIGHEMAHVIRGHAIDRIKLEWSQKALSAVSVATPAGRTVAPWLRRVGVGWLERAYSREQEFEADELGGRLMRAAAFDPQRLRPHAGTLPPDGARVRSTGSRRLHVDPSTGRRPHPPPVRAPEAGCACVNGRTRSSAGPDSGASPLSHEGRTRRRFARRLRLLGIPDDLTGWSVLDVGAWHGFFSFECERRGADRVLAVDSFAWDRFGMDEFLAARERLGSSVEHRRADVHELDPDEIGQLRSRAAARRLLSPAQPAGRARTDRTGHEDGC